MKIATPKQMRLVDNTAITQTGIPGIVLMENAALKVVEEITNELGNFKNKKVLIFAGKGNNGGDAFAVARHLYNNQCRVKVYVLFDPENSNGDARINYNIIKNMGLPVEQLTEATGLNFLGDILESADLVIDGIFGTGLKGRVKGLYEEVINIINNSGVPVISIDIPSGVDGETGKVDGTCIKAKTTVTFVLPKTGLVVHPGCDACGKLVVADIGIPQSIIQNAYITTNLIDNEIVSDILPKRLKNSNKGNYGRVLIISGSTGMTGAGCLAARAALRTGAGLVYLGVPQSLVPIYEAAVTEAVTLSLADKDSGSLSEKCIHDIISKLKAMTVALVGPGLSVTSDVENIVNNIIKQSEVPLILDADALNAIADDPAILLQLRVGAVVTPHPGEMARLTGISIEQVQNNRIETACEFASRWKVITVLKGSRTIVALPDGTVYVNPTGNPGMATAGTGDVLAGIIASLAAQGAALPEAAVAGVYIHGIAGDSAAEDRGEHGIIAGDLIEQLPYVMKKIKNCNKS